MDVQNDFCPGGALAVEHGDEVIPGLNRIIGFFEVQGLPIFYSRDWHPPNHISFKAQGGVWPPHCVQGTSGAEFHPRLRVLPGAVVISKGDNPLAEAYSTFQGTDLEVRLKKLGIDEIFLGGLTTDYCVRDSTLDARRGGFSVVILEDCTKPVNVKPGDGARALADIGKSGAIITTVSEAIKRLASTQQ